MKAVAKRSARTMHHALSLLARGALDLVYPPHCFACTAPIHQGLDPLCPECRASIRPVEDSCPTCGTPLGPFAPDAQRCESCRNRKLFFDGARGAFLYEGPVKRLLHRLKFERFAQAAKPLSALAVTRLEASPFPGPFQAVVPVPMHWRKKHRRGYNQAELLAKGIARRLGLPAVRALAKTRTTDAQVDLPRSKRLDNPQGAYRARRAGRIRGRSILLVDDIMTTASTVSACAQALKECGAEKVYAFAVARQA